MKSIIRPLLYCYYTSTRGVRMKLVIASVTLMAFLTALSSLLLLSSAGYDLPPSLRDTEPNDTMEEAEEIYAGGSFVEGSLSAGDLLDFYKVFLNADEDGRGAEAEKAIIYLDRLSGATVVAEVSEGWGGPLVVVRASSGQSRAEFVAPRTGYYYISVKTSPGGGEATYRLQVGVVKVDISERWDGNNRPEDAAPVLGTTHISIILNPLSNILDYYEHSLAEGFKIRVEGETKAENLQIELLNESLALLDEGGIGDPPEYGLPQGPDETIYVRVYLRVDPTYPAVDVDKKVELDITVWSYSTAPEVNPADPWEAPLLMEEDTPLHSALNLSQHFIERGGDPLRFSVDENPYLNVTIYPEGTADIVPAENWWGMTSLTFHAADLDGVATDTIQVNVAPVNDPPRILTLNGIGAHPSRGYVAFWVTVEETLVIVPEVVDVDDEERNLTFSLNQTPENLLVNPSNGTIVYSPTWNDLGMRWINLMVEDSAGGVDNSTIRIEVIGYNRPPNPPEIYVVEPEHNRVAGSPLNFVAILHGDPDGDPIAEIVWKMGDGNIYRGEDRVTHTYSSPGNYTVLLSVCDPYGMCTNVTLDITVHSKPSQGGFLSGYRRFWKDLSGDAVVYEKRQNTDFLYLRQEGRDGVDLLNVTAEGRLDGLLVTIHVKGGVIIDGSVKYTIYIVTRDFAERPVKVNITRIEDFLPPAYFGSSQVFLYRTFSGILNNPFNFTVQGDRLVLFIPLKDLVSASVPLREGNFSVFATSEESSQTTTKTGQIRSFRSFDTAGEGAVVYNVTPRERESGSEGGGERVFKDNTLTFILLGVVGVVILVVAVLMLKKYRKKEEEEIERFEEEVKRLKEEGRSLYEMVEEGGEGEGPQEGRGR